MGAMVIKRLSAGIWVTQVLELGGDKNDCRPR